eukprot:scaffold64935_cov31-Cyclotella_meneghiniana.AAC.5
MASLADAIKAETAVLEAIASAPLPDSSFLNGRSQICNESDSMQMKITAVLPLGNVIQFDHYFGDQ